MTNCKTYWHLFIYLIIPLVILPVRSQKVDDINIKRMVQQYKNDIRGPYKDIRWYCPDGTVIPPKERCPDPGGVQRARYKDEIISLAKTNHVFLGQILSTTPFPDYWDEANNNSRLKQYQLEKYLRAIDNGWILRRAQYYRGAFQVEDEEIWGIDFLNWLLMKDEVLTRHYFLIRQAVKDIPHKDDNSLTQSIRAVSSEISDVYPAFLDIRVKIHGQPDKTDISKTIAFRDNHKNMLTPEILKKFEKLIGDMGKVYQPVNLEALNDLLKFLPKDTEPEISMAAFIEKYKNSSALPERIEEIAKLLWELRTNILTIKTSQGRLAALDISNILEEILYREIVSLEIATIGDNISIINSLAFACAGCGYIEKWEWETVSEYFNFMPDDEWQLNNLIDYFESARRIVEWSTGMFTSVYEDDINLYAGFEPLVDGFIDDKIRSTLLLYLGNNISSLGNYIASQLTASSQVMDISTQSGVRGINPGYALGELVVISETTDKIEFSKDKIYVFNKPPPDLEPVAGIATVSEGNMVSHVQLLARNLGIPNAVLSAQNLNELKKYSGQKVFYAVSGKGTVVMKPYDQMINEEKALFEQKKRDENKINVPMDKLDVSQADIMNLNEINAKHSGGICGPKAANLGQLKMMFPDNVVDGIVIPFGIFKKHLEQQIPGKNISYWEYLNNIFSVADEMYNKGKNETEVEDYTLKELEYLRNLIKQIKLIPEFIDSLENAFKSVFNCNLGEIPVFLRSDTNMEDLKDFTGAGLNLTLFNVVSSERILQGIKDVWASPYTERSYKWRQYFLLNPENVFPSILIIPTVNVDYSGVMITKGIITGDEKDLSIAFSRGAGGAVEGQAAESYILKHDGRCILLSPAREQFYNYLPVTGGIEKKKTSFESPILNSENITALRQIAEEIKIKLLEAPGIETIGPFDIELGFKDNKLWLFQVRPFVENKNAAGSAYLESINPAVPENKIINFNHEL